MTSRPDGTRDAAGPAAVWPPSLRQAEAGHVLELARSGTESTVLETSCLALIMRPGREPLRVPISGWRMEGDELVLDGAADGWQASARWTPRDETCHFLEVVLELLWTGREPATAGLRLPFRIPVAPAPAWLIPGAFYGQNRPAGCARPFPRHDPAANGSGGGLISDHWSFRADRAALGAVFAWGSAACVGLAADELGPLGLAGLGLSGRGDDASIWLDMPYREEPVRYTGLPEPQPSIARHARWEPDVAVTLAYQVFVGEGDPHAYDPFLRAIYRRRRPVSPLAPWMGPERAAALAAHGLVRWHFRDVATDAGPVAILAETAGFDREAGDGRGGTVDRENMHVGWVSGTPWAAALLRFGRLRGDAQATEAAIAVLDTIVAGGVSPSGTFWGEWRAGSGWGGGWNPSGWVHARTVSEATLFLLRAIAHERAAGQAHPAWEAAARSSLAFAATRQTAQGDLGLYYDPLSGAVTARGTAAGLPWIPALLSGAVLFDEPAWREAALLAGRHYASFVDDAYIAGAVEDVPTAATSEDGYAAIMAYVRLHEADQTGEWLRLARRAADWTMTYRYAWNVPFSPETILGRYDFRTRGGDQASSCNQHLHAYGLLALPEMLSLWRATADDYYLQRTRDNLACFLQFVAREDGDFGARRGMVSERYYQTDCFGPRGGLLSLSHAWSVGAVLHACLAALDEPDPALLIPAEEEHP